MSGKDLEKIVLVQTSFLGDLVLSTPLIAALKELYPDSELFLVTTPLASELVRRDPLVTGVIPFDKRGEYSGFRGLLSFAKLLRSYRFTRAYALQRSLRTTLVLRLAGIPYRVGFHEANLSFLYQVRARRPSEKHEVMRNMALLREEFQVDEKKAKLRLFPPAIEEVGEKVREITEGERAYALLAPGSAWATKRWHPEGFHGVAKYLLKRGLSVVLIGSKDEREVANIVGQGLDVCNLVGEIPLADTLYLVSKASLMVCNDSMAAHLASAFKIPTVEVFCATSPEFGFGPWQNPLARVVEVIGLGCKPCHRHGTNRCPTGTESCMRDLSAERVIAFIKEVL